MSQLERITSFSQLIIMVQNLPPRRVAVAAAHDEHVLKAVQAARRKGIASFILVGDAAETRRIAAESDIDLTGISLIDQPNDKLAVIEAVRLVSESEADLLMKGLVGTAELLRVVLDKERGLRTGRMLSIASVMEIPGFDRLLIITDGGMIISPTLAQKVDIILNSISLASALGITQPNAAILAAVELINPEMPATIDAAILSKMAERGQIPGVQIDGPLAFDNAINLAAAQHKKIHSPVAGKADILVVPDIEAGNMLVKALVYCANAKIAGLVLGAQRPIVVTSRSDTPEAKMLSIALGVLMA